MFCVSFPSHPFPPFPPPILLFILAQLSSVKGLKQFGLNAEQILQLNYFATQLKKGVAAGDIAQPTDGKSREMVRENNNLKEKLRRIKIKLEMYQVRHFDFVTEDFSIFTFQPILTRSFFFKILSTSIRMDIK